MKKFKKSLVLATVAVLGLSFCGLFSEGARAATKTTHIEWTFTDWDTDGNSHFDFQRTTDIVGDMVSISCTTGMMYFITNNANKHSDSIQLSSLTRDTSYCEGKYNGIWQQFHDNGVTVVSAAAWVGYAPYGSPDNTKNWEFVRSSYGDKGLAEVFCSGAWTYIVTGPGFYTRFAAKSCAKTDIENQLKDQGFTIGWWERAGSDLNQWPTKLVEEGVFPDWYKNGLEPVDPADPADPSGGEDPGVPNTDDPGNNGSGGTKWNYGNNGSDEASILRNCAHAGKKEVNGEWVTIEGQEGEGIRCIIELVVDVLTVGIGILAVIGIIIVGVQYLTSGGNDEKAKKAKRRLLEVVIGVVLYVIAYAVLKWLMPSFK